MKIKSFSLLWIGVALLVAACGDSLTDPAIERNDPGTGTGTLDIRADVDAFDESGGLITEFRVRVRDGSGNDVSGATVTITNAGFGVVTLLQEGGAGDYEADRNTFHEGDYALRVVSGTDVVEGVVLGGPGVHTITEPLANATATADQDLTVRWDVPSQARSAEVETNDFGPLLLPDTGAVVIPGGSNPVNDSQFIRVFRFNEVDIAGGLFGSRMRVEVRQTVEPVIVQ